jgi:hypothetical protein
MPSGLTIDKHPTPLHWQDYGTPGLTKVALPHSNVVWLTLGAITMSIKSNGQAYVRSYARHGRTFSHKSVCLVELHLHSLELLLVEANSSLFRGHLFGRNAFRRIRTSSLHLLKGDHELSEDEAELSTPAGQAIPKEVDLWVLNTSLDSSL